MNKAAEMVSRLRQSVAEIMASDAADKDALLGKSFQEFEEALNKSAEEDQAALIAAIEQEQAEAAEAADPLLHFAEAIGTADDLAGQMVEAGAVDEATAELLGQWSALNDLVARSLVNHRVAPVMEGEDVEALKADGLGLLEMPLAKADGAGPEAILLKTDLPEELHALITDPAEIQGALAELGFGLAKSAGAPVEAMLAKFEEAQAADPNAEAPAEPVPADPVEALARQVQVMMRLSAASLVQGQQILSGLAAAGEEVPQEQDGGVPPEDTAAAGKEGHAEPDGDEQPGAKGDGDADAKAKAEGSEKPEAGDKPEAKEGEDKKPFGKAESAEDLQKAIQDELRKAVDAATAPLRKQVERANAELARLRAQPQAPKAPLMAVTKAADGVIQNSGEDTLSKLAGLSPEQQALALTKMIHQSAAIPVGL